MMKIPFLAIAIFAQQSGNVVPGTVEPWLKVLFWLLAGLLCVLKIWEHFHRPVTELRKDDLAKIDKDSVARKADSDRRIDEARAESLERKQDSDRRLEDIRIQQADHKADVEKQLKDMRAYVHEMAHGIRGELQALILESRERSDRLSSVEADTKSHSRTLAAIDSKMDRLIEATGVLRGKTERTR